MIDMNQGKRSESRRGGKRNCGEKWIKTGYCDALDGSRKWSLRPLNDSAAPGGDPVPGYVDDPLKLGPVAAKPSSPTARCRRQSPAFHIKFTRRSLNQPYLKPPDPDVFFILRVLITTTRLMNAMKSFTAQYRYHLLSLFCS